MRMILFIVAMVISGIGGQDVESVLAAQPQSGRVGQQFIYAQDFEKAIYTILTRQYGRPHHRVNVRILFPKKPLSVSSGKLHLEVEKLTGGARMGRRSFRVGVFINGQFTKTINVVGEVKAQVIVATPVRWMKSKDIIVPEDLTVMTIDVPSLTHDFILQQDEVIGKRVLRPLSPRQPIRKIMLDDPPLVHKGDRVMIEVRQGGLFVQAIGLAKAEGKSGDTILVQNKNSGREVIATVLSAGLVEVGF